MGHLVSLTVPKGKACPPELIQATKALLTAGRGEMVIIKTIETQSLSIGNTSTGRTQVLTNESMNDTRTKLGRKPTVSGKTSLAIRTII